MAEARVIRYQSCYPGLRKKLFNENPQVYRAALIYIRLDELQERGAKMIRVGKPNSGGTEVTFAPVETAEEYQEELERIVADGKEICLEFEKIES